jgi:flagellar biosynthetic protein FliR
MVITLAEELARPLGVFVLVLARVASLMLTAPVMGSVAVPLPARLMLALMLTLFVAPLYVGSSWPSPDASGFARAVLREATLGATLGFAAAVVLWGLQSSMHMLLQVAGLSSLEQEANGTENSSSPVGQAVQLVAVAVLLVSGGHRLILGSLLNTFRWAPPGSSSEAAGAWQLLADLLGLSFAFGLRVTLPVICCVLFSSVVVSLITRALPQLHLSPLNPSLNLSIILATLTLTLGTTGWLLQDQLVVALERILEFWRAS